MVVSEKRKATAGSKVTKKSRTAGSFSPRTRMFFNAGGELKNIDVTSPFPALVAAGAGFTNPNLLNGVAQGTTATTRLGRRIVMKSLFIRATIRLAATTAGESTVRFLVVYDKQTNAVAANNADVFEVPANIMSPMNLGNSNRFKVLCDKVIPCLGATGPSSIVFQKYIKMNHPVEFNSGSAGTVGDIQTGSVYAYCGQDGGLITAAPVTTAYTRIRFSDN